MESIIQLKTKFLKLKIYTHNVINIMVILTAFILGFYYVRYFHEIRFQYFEIQNIISTNKKMLTIKNRNLKEYNKNLELLEEINNDISNKKIGTSSNIHKVIINLSKIMEESNLVEEEFKVIKNGEFEANEATRTLNETIIIIGGHGKISDIKKFVDKINYSSYFYKIDYINITRHKNATDYFVNVTVSVYN